MTTRGSALENTVDRLLATHTMRDFLYLRPSKIVGGLRREISDLLIVLDGKTVPVQLKGQGKARQADALQHWATKKAVNAGGQASGACRTLRSVEVTADHPTQGQVSFAPGDLLPIHGLAIVGYDGEAFQTDEELRHADPYETPIHYMSLADFLGLMEAVGSLPDLLEYLQSRSQLSSDIRSWIGAEPHLFASYILDDGFDPTLAASTVLSRAKALPPERLNDLQRTRSHDVFVQPINYAIEHLHERDPEVGSYASGFMTGSIEHADRRRGYLAMAAKLNRLPHRVRQEIGARILEMESKAKPDVAPWSLYIFATDGTPIVFVVSAEPERRRRAEVLWPILRNVLLKTGRTTGMVVCYPTLNLKSGLLFLHAGDIDLGEFAADTELLELISKMPEAKFIPVPKAPPPQADQRFELLRQPR